MCRHMSWRWAGEVCAKWIEMKNVHFIEMEWIECELDGIGKKVRSIRRTTSVCLALICYDLCLWSLYFVCVLRVFPLCSWDESRSWILPGQSSKAAGRRAPIWTRSQCHCKHCKRGSTSMQPWAEDNCVAMRCHALPCVAMRCAILHKSFIHVYFVVHPFSYCRSWKMAERFGYRHVEMFEGSCYDW